MNHEKKIIIALIIMLGITQLSLAYPSNWEGSIITKTYSSATEQNWWLKGYLLQDGYKHHITNSETFWRIYNSNGKRYFGVGDYSIDSIIDSIPEGNEVTSYTTITPTVIPTPIQQTRIEPTYIPQPSTNDAFHPAPSHVWGIDPSEYQNGGTPTGFIHFIFRVIGKGAKEAGNGLMDGFAN